VDDGCCGSSSCVSVEDVTGVVENQTLVTVKQLNASTPETLSLLPEPALGLFRHRYRSNSFRRGYLMECAAL